ncbi:Pkinase-domain-containing protein [Marasmius fiardii PR-910]|nr:Pkinase-domain-containing protein [Marasmius fiardii PR-910]
MMATIALSSSDSPPATPSARSILYGIPGIRGQTSPFPTTPTTAQGSSLLDPPVGINYRDFIRTWSDSHVARWLTDIKCSIHATTFRQNDIRGDILLELDQITLQEMGVASIGDRLRILNAVKILRQKCQASKSPSTTPVDPSPSSSTGTRSARRPGGRPAPLTLHANNKDNLPALVRESPAIRPLPNPATQPVSNTSDSTSNPHSARLNLPPLPPVPRYQPPLPPSSRQPSRPPHNTSRDRGEVHTPSSPWSGYHLPADPRPGNLGGGKTPQTSTPGRSTSPLPPAGARTKASTGSSSSSTPTSTNNHGRSGSGGSTPKRTVPSTGSHPYASALHPPHPPHQQPNLSPIQEQFGGASTPVTPSAPSHPYTVGRGPFNPPVSSHTAAPSLDDLRRKLCKFFLPDEGQGLTFTIDVDSCAGGVEIIEKVLKKFGKGGNRSTDNDGAMDHVTTEGGGLSVDGWGVFLDEGASDPLSEAELLTICHAPADHPTREHPLILRRIARQRRYEPPSPIKFSNGKGLGSTKRASSVSVLSALGVRDPERALDPPSPTHPGLVSPTPSPAKVSPPATKRPSKLRNFFGQRPPSELITNNLTEFFPNTEKKVLERTARNSMMLRSNTMSSRRESIASFLTNPSLPSRFSSSTQGSGRSPSRTSFSSVAPPLPEKPGIINTNVNGGPMDLTPSPEDGIPRMSLSTEDGRSVELSGDEAHGHTPASGTVEPQLLPPIPFPTESLSESLEGAITPSEPHRISRASSNASRFSRRMSYMTELRSKRSKESDAASMMTVDEITKEVENRVAEKQSKKRDSIALSVNVHENTSDVDGEDWTEVDGEEGGKELGSGDGVPDTPMDEAEKVGEEEFEPDEMPDEEEEEETDLESDMDGAPKRGGKWIKGALIGSGSFGQVFLGMDASTGTLMAVKQVELPTGSSANLERKKSMLSALEHEIELLQDLQHDNIVQYLYSSLENDCLNIFLEYVPGGSVTALLRNYGAFEETLVKNFVRQILQGLSYLHERGIIHRDIKGANILVDNKGGVKISDFGISKKMDMQALTGNRTHRPSLQGSVFWMAPEVVKQTTHTEKADIWSVGCLVVEMLTGEHPWAQLSQMQAIFKIGSSAKPTIPSDITTEAQDFLSRTFEIDHTARPSASELLQHPFISAKKK